MKQCKGCGAPHLNETCKYCGGYYYEKQGELPSGKGLTRAQKVAIGVGLALMPILIYKVLNGRTSSIVTRRKLNGELTIKE